MAVIHILDNGLGMDDDTQKRLFTPYAHENTPDDGIGLYVSKQLIELHGGTLQIRLDSKQRIRCVLYVTSC